MVSGSMAMAIYSLPRMTRDIDIVIEISSAQDIFENFRDKFYLDLNTIESAIKNRGMFNVIFFEKVMKIDFIVRKNSTYRSLEFSRRQKMDFCGFSVFVVSPEDLIISKLIWAKDAQSSLQLQDARNLYHHLNDLDRIYLDKWTAKLGIRNEYERAIS